MNEILKYTTVNVVVKDRETGLMLFSDHNLFLDAGRVMIANFFLGSSSLDTTKFSCDFGNDSTTPLPTDLDLGGQAIPSTSWITNASAPVSASYPILLSGTATGIHFLFEYTSAAENTVKELGLFYRPNTDNNPVVGGRGSDPTTMTGTMIARLRTTFASIVIGSGKTITIEWKIIF